MMLEKMADLEVLEVVATLDFAHRHSCLLPVVVKSTKPKSPEAEPVFYGITGCTSILLLGAGVTPAQGSMKPTAGFIKIKQ
jgi:hypothetical protein